MMVKNKCFKEKPLENYPVQEWKQDDLQLVPHILIIHLKIILWVGEIPANLHHQSQMLKQD